MDDDANAIYLPSEMLPYSNLNIVEYILLS